jgi:hypothetical protein
LGNSLSVEDLILWLKSQSINYKTEYDQAILSISDNHAGFLTKQDLSAIYKWKLQAHHFVAAKRQLDEYEENFHGEIEKKTGMAFLAPSDDEALECLRGIPQIKLKDSVAVASCLLMVLKPNLFTVIDRRANETLCNLKAIISLFNQSEQLARVEELLMVYAPLSTFEARSRDWSLYLQICRELAKFSGLTLRELDRALYSAKGDFSLLHSKTT